MPGARFPARALATIDATKYFFLRAGDEHRFIPVWVVVTGGRVLVRSWNDAPDGWLRAFLREKRGAVRVGVREVAVRAMPVKSARLNDGADAAYAAKYTSRANLEYVRGLASPRRRATTLELRPA